MGSTFKIFHIELIVLLKLWVQTYYLVRLVGVYSIYIHLYSVLKVMGSVDPLPKACIHLCLDLYFRSVEWFCLYVKNVYCLEALHLLGLPV